MIQWQTFYPTLETKKLFKSISNEFNFSCPSKIVLKTYLKQKNISPLYNLHKDIYFCYFLQRSGYRVKENRFD